MNTNVYTPDDRILAWRAIRGLLHDEEVMREEDEAAIEMTGAYGDAYEQDQEHLELFEQSDALIEDWLLMDRPLLLRGCRPIELLLEGKHDFAPGVRRCLEVVARSALRGDGRGAGSVDLASRCLDPA